MRLLNGEAGHGWIQPGKCLTEAACAQSLPKSGRAAKFLPYRQCPCPNMSSFCLVPANDEIGRRRAAIGRDNSQLARRIHVIDITEHVLQLLQPRNKASSRLISVENWSKELSQVPQLLKPFAHI